MKKIISFILVIALCLSLCAPAFAADEEFDYSRYADGYLAFGDSFTRGYNASEKWPQEGYTIEDPNNPICRNVTDSYPVLLAEAFGCEHPDDITEPGTYWPCATSGLTLSAVLDLMGIEDYFYDDMYIFGPEHSSPRYRSLLKYFGDEYSFAESGEGYYGKTGIVGSIRDLVAKAKVITVSLGMNDIFTAPLWVATHSYLTEDLDTSDPLEVAVAVEQSLAIIFEFYERFVDSFPLLLDYLKENATGDVVILGITNPVNGIYLSDESLLPLGDVASFISDRLNEYFEQWCREYGFCYVDISNVETGGVEYEVALLEALENGGLDVASNPELGAATHPTPNGYRQIAREIMRVLAEKHSNEKIRKTDIRVDLGRFDNVDYVMLDGKLVSDYTVENSFLTVHNNSLRCSTMTTAVIKDGKLAITVYKLSYDRDSGYSVYRLYTTNSVMRIVKNVVTLAKNAVSLASKMTSSIVDKLKR